MKQQRQLWIFLFALGLAGATAWAQTFGDLKSGGSGTFESNCIHTLTSGCTISANGQVSGIPIAGAVVLRLDTGSPLSLNGNIYGNQGVCVPAMGTGRITEPDGDSIEFNTVGMVCEEREDSSPVHYNGTYRITVGAGAFLNAKGTGNVSSTYVRTGFFTRGGGDFLVHLTGMISN